MDLNNLEWVKSSHSGVSGGDCVEVAAAGPGLVVVRDSKNPSGGTIFFTYDEWNAFLSRAPGDSLTARAFDLVVPCCRQETSAGPDGLIYARRHGLG